jgi:4-hydroxy-2-oxoheptanedioate aldolase
MIETAEDARRLVHACRYPPDGGRSFGPVRARLAWGDGYAANANVEILPIAMIETKAAVEHLDSILAVPGLGGVYIGPADLALSHGFPPGFDREEPEMLALIRRILSRCCAAGLPCCLHCGGPEYAARMAQEGMALLTVGSDARFIEAGAKAATRAFRSAS